MCALPRACRHREKAACFLNYFDTTVSVQLSFINRGTRSGGAKKVVAIPAQNDAFNSIRTEYADMLKHQLAKGNNGFVKSKYITFSVEADNLNAAKARLARIETDILNNFKVLGAAARPMTGYERPEALHSVFHPEGDRSVSLGIGSPRRGLPQRTLSPRPRSVSARADISAWDAKSARSASLKSLRRS